MLACIVKVLALAICIDKPYLAKVLGRTSCIITWCNLYSFGAQDTLPTVKYLQQPFTS